MTELGDPGWPVVGLVGARIGGMMLTAPFWGSRVISIRFRLALCLMLAVSIAPLVGNGIEFAYESHSQFLFKLLGELLIGALLGLGVQIIFKSMMIAGELIGVPLGFRATQTQGGRAALGDDSFQQTASPTGKLFDLTAIGVFVLIGGPGFLIQSVVQSTTTHPVGSGLDSDITQSMMQMVGASFLLGLRIALPILVCHLLSILVVGMVSRTLPQISTFQVGLPLTVAVTLIAILLGIGSSVLLFGDRMETITRQIWEQPDSAVDQESSSAFKREVDYREVRSDG